MKNDPVKWSKEDITKFERSLHRFIPLIRFYDIEPTDFFYKVYCYKDILPQDLIHDLLEFHIVPNMKPKTNVAPPRKPNFKLDSTLIKPEHIPLFSSWIDKKDSFHYNIKNSPYEFNLLYRASRDGNTAKAFHEKCDNMGATIVVTKIKNSEQIVGGYNPLFWDSSYNYKSTNDSLIFSFADGNKIQSAKVGYSNGNEYSIRCYPVHGPIFGGGNDLVFNGSTWRSTYSNTNSTYYPKINIPANFNMDDGYEVFQVVKM